MADGAAPTGDNQAPSGPRGDGNRGRGRGRGGRGRGRGDHSRGRGRGGGGGRGGGAGHHRSGNTATTDPASQEPKKAPNFKKTEALDGQADDNAETCFICANPITHFSVAPCNHTTCHICSLRLRALYKSKDCPHCRVRSASVDDLGEHELTYLRRHHRHMLSSPTTEPSASRTTRPRTSPAQMTTLVLNTPGRRLWEIPFFC